MYSGVNLGLNVAHRLAGALVPFHRSEDGSWEITSVGWTIVIAVLGAAVSGAFSTGALIWQVGWMTDEIKRSTIDRGDLWHAVQIIKEQDHANLWASITANATRLTKLEGLAAETRSEQERRGGRLEGIERRLNSLEVSMAGVDQIRETLRAQEIERNRRADQLNSNLADLNGTLDQLRTTLNESRMSTAAQLSGLAQEQKRTNERLEDLLSGRLVPLNPFQAPRRQP